MVRARALRVLPESRSECRGSERPCPYLSCRFHLLLDVTSDGRLYLTRELDEQDEDSIADALREMPETCALDVADRGASTSRTIADLLGMARRQGVEETVSAALEKIRALEVEFEQREHPEDFYIRYSEMGAQELADLTAELRARGRGSMDLGHRFDFHTQCCGACGITRHKAETEQRTCRSVRVRAGNKKRKAKRGYR